MSAPLPTFAFLDVLTPSLRRANLEACAKLVARDIEYWSAEMIVSKRERHSTNAAFAQSAIEALDWAKIERRKAIARRRRLWALADVFNVCVGQSEKRRMKNSRLSPGVFQLLQSARDRYGTDYVEAA